MRVFVAVDIGDITRRALADLQKKLQGQVDIKKSDAKWVRPENVHLTLKFLGEIKDEEAVEVCKAIKDTASRNKGFQLDVESLGYFGRKSARILWVGCGRGSSELGSLQKQIEYSLSGLGFPEEKRLFSGHLTLCRIRNPKAGLKLADISRVYKDVKVGTISVKSVCVYQSHLQPSGPVYIKLGDYQLA